jgi:hypothetical protein
MMNVDFIDVIHTSQREEYFFIQTVVWRQIADELLVRNPAVKYVEVRDKVDSELATVFQQYCGRLDKYLEERSAETRDNLPDLK